MAQQIRRVAAHPEDLCLVHSTPQGGSQLLYLQLQGIQYLWPLQSSCAHTHKQMHIPTHDLKL